MKTLNRIGLASFRRGKYVITGINFLSKCFALLLFSVFSQQVYSQNTITIKKAEQEEKVSYSGFYYSEKYTISNGTPGQPPADLRRLYMYVDANNMVFLFHSTLPVAKMYKKFMKNPSKYYSETGTLEVSKKDLYMKTTLRDGTKVYRYVGDIMEQNRIYLSYKATQKYKKSLDLALYKYSG
ncbi:MAG: hypothetical protein ACI8Q1_003729 [Parvicella sp.]|jgi:hypothetical protein